MTATTVDRGTQRRDSSQFAFPVAASTKIPGGVIVALNASGLAVNGATATTLKAVGVSEALADNSAGAASDIKVNVRRGCFKFGNSTAGDAIALADVGASCYIVDNQTVAKTNGSSTRSVAGTIRDVDADGGVWVEF
jgi:hypothetical protein